MERLRRQTRKALIGIVGGLVTLIGLVLIPYPGPGWLIVFAGLAILATEFQFASRLLHFLKGKYEAWVEWLKQQHPFMRGIVLLITAAIVVITIWLLNGFGILNDVLNLPYTWVRAPYLA